MPPAQQKVQQSTFSTFGTFVLREAALRKLQGLFGHCLNGEGGRNGCQDGLGHPYIWVKMRKEVPQGARLSEGGGRVGAIALWAMPE